MRKYIFIVFSINLLIATYGVMNAPAPSSFSLSTLILMIYSFVTAIATALLAYFVWKDGEELEDLRELIRLAKSRDKDVDA